VTASDWCGGGDKSDKSQCGEDTETNGDEFNYEQTREREKEISLLPNHCGASEKKAEQEDRDCRPRSSMGRVQKEVQRVIVNDIVMKVEPTEAEEFL
jgi:hypothetical protein